MFVGHNLRSCVIVDSCGAARSDIGSRSTAPQSSCNIGDWVCPPLAQKKSVPLTKTFFGARLISCLQTTAVLCRSSPSFPSREIVRLISVVSQKQTFRTPAQVVGSICLILAPHGVVRACTCHTKRVGRSGSTAPQCWWPWGLLWRI